MKKIYQAPTMEEITVHIQPLMEPSLEVSGNEQDNDNAFSRESGWDYDD